MDIRGLSYFVAIAELGSFNKAADRLRVTQPALSRQVRNLEDELGVRLFLRHGQGVTLTETGQKFLQRVSFILESLEQLRLETVATANVPVGQVSIATTPAVGSLLLPVVIERYCQRAPQVAVRTLQGLSGAIGEALSKGQVDIAVMPLSAHVEREFTIRPLMSHQVVVVGSAESELAGRTTVPFSELAGMPLIMPARMNSLRSTVEAKAQQLGITLRTRVEVDGLTSSRALVRRRIGYWITHLDSVHEDVASGLLVAPLIIRPSIDRISVVATQPRRPLSAAASLLLDLLHQAAQELIAGGIWRAVG